MITGSVVLAAVAAAFLGVGLVSGDNAYVYYYCSIVGSVLAGFALFVGLRYRLAAQLPDDDFDGPLPSDRRRVRPMPGPRAGRAAALQVRPDRVTGRARVPAAPEPAARSGSDDLGHPEPGWEERDREDGAWDEGADGWDEGAAVATVWPEEDDPEASLPDEPDEQHLTGAVAAQVARLGAEVLVIDGRPRYHLDACLHLLGRTTHRLPVMDVVALGFTPCGDCEPATTLLGGSAG